tara:strand:+ start:1 stop:2313 length:2313 start_codon:yes stop_codon:yes gene_type:complete
MTTATNKPMIKSSAFNPYNPTGMPTNNQWIVTTTEKQSIPTMSGGVFQADAPVENVFETRKEAEIFAKKNQPKVFSGTNNELFNRFNYASAVDAGEVQHPKTTPSLLDDTRYYAGVTIRPLYNIGAMAHNLVVEQKDQVPILETATERLISGSISDTMGLDPLKGSGVSSAYEYAKEDPLRTALELPAEALLWVTGGKAIQLGVRGASVVKGGLAVSKVIPQPLKTVGTKIESGVNTVTSIPSKIGSSIYTYGTVPRGYGTGGYKVFRSELGDKQFTTGQQIVRQGIVTPYNIIRTGKEKILQYNPLTRWEYSQTKKIGSSIYPDEVPRRIEKIGNTYVITAGTESFPQSVPAIMVKFGKGGKTSYFTEADDLTVTGSSGMIIRGDLPKGIADATKTNKFVFEVPVKDDMVKLKDYSKTGKEYAVPLQSFYKQGTGEHIGFKISEKTGIARKSDEPPFYRVSEKETIIDTPTTPRPTGIKYDLDGKIIKETKSDINPNTLKDLYGKTSGTSKKDIVELPPSKGGQTLTTPVKTVGKGEKLKLLAKEQAKLGTKKSPYSSAIVGSATKAIVVVGTKSLTSTRVDAGVKVQQKTKTGLKTETGLKTKTKIKTGMRLKIKLDTGLKTQQKTALAYSTPLKMTGVSKTPKVLPIILPRVEEKVKTRRGKRGKKAGFIANVRTDNIMGMYKRSEITYGKKKVSRLERQDARLTAKTTNRISMSASGLLKTKTKGKKKSTSVFGTETKDEFAGFNTKGKKKKSKSKKTKSKKIRLM